LNLNVIDWYGEADGWVVHWGSVFGTCMKGVIQDEDFILLNHVNGVVNCTSGFLPNYFEHYQIKYVQVEWRSFKTDRELGSEVVGFIERVRGEGQAVMIHGQ